MAQQPAEAKAAAAAATAAVVATLTGVWKQHELKLFDSAAPPEAPPGAPPQTGRISWAEVPGQNAQRF